MAKRSAGCDTAFDLCRDDGHGYFEGECTSFAAWAIRADGMSHTTSPDFMGDAMSWTGASVESSPHAGDIAQWDPGYDEAGPAGHVAYVAAVRGDGSIELYEYNWSLTQRQRFDVRTITPGAPDAPSRHLRF